MKTKITCFVITIFLVIPRIGYTSNFENNRLAKGQSQRISRNSIQQTDSLLNNIEHKINKAFVKDLINQTDGGLVTLEQALQNMNKTNNNSIIVYWYSYACYYHSIFSLIQNDLKKSEKMNDEGIEALDEVDPKNSEHYALLAFMKSLSIKYSAGIKIPFISASVKKYAEKALSLDSVNLRAYYVLGSNDFYTPEQYGGGKKAEGYFKKAIQLDNQSVKNPYLPSWGKNSAYELLIRLYIKRKQFDEAKNYYHQAIALFPNDYMIKKLGRELNKNSNQYYIQHNH